MPQHSATGTRISPNSRRLFMSIINLGEVYYNIGKLRGEDFSNGILAELRLLPIYILAVDEATVFAAARWRMKFPISNTDAFAATTADQLDAILVTGDPELVALTGHLKIELLVGAS